MFHATLLRVISWRPALRFVTLLVGGVAFVVALVILALPIWLRTPYGHGAIERVLTDLLNERVPGTIAVGRQRQEAG